MNNRFVDKVLFASSVLVAGSTAALPYVGGYGTRLFQLVVIGAWLIIERFSSGLFADQHHGLLWTVAFFLNMILFAIVAVPLWLLTRRQLPKLSPFLIMCWTVFYLAMLFILFPATDGP